VSDTPLTDKAAIGFARILVDRETHECVEIIPSDFARTLERQLAEAQATIERMKPVVEAAKVMANGFYTMTTREYAEACESVIIQYRRYETKEPKP
jgi:hypothetical protein